MKNKQLDAEHKLKAIESLIEQWDTLLPPQFLMIIIPILKNKGGEK